MQYTKHFEVGDVQYSIEHRTDGIGEAGDSELSSSSLSLSLTLSLFTTLSISTTIFMALSVN